MKGHNKLPWWTKCIQVQLKSCTCMKHLSSPSCRPGLKPCIRKVPCRREWQPTSVFLSRKSHGQRSLVVSSPVGGKESDTTEQVKLAVSSSWLLWHIIKTGGTSDYGSGVFLSRAKQVLLFFWASNIHEITVWVKSSPKYVLKALIHMLVVNLGIKLKGFLKGSPSQTSQDLPEQTAPASLLWEWPSGWWSITTG